MSASHKTSKHLLHHFFEDEAIALLSEQLRPRLPEEKPLPPRIKGLGHNDQQSISERRQLLATQGIKTDAISHSHLLEQPEQFERNIENLIGFAQIPLGVLGPLRINGAYANNDYYVPLATSEGALVASYQRGASLISLAGGCTAFCVGEAVSRAPCFVFDNMREAFLFLRWVMGHVEHFQKVVSSTSNHCQFLDLKTSIIGKEVYLIFDFTTGDAAGQNMVTLASQALCDYIIAHNPTKPVQWFIEGNLSGDKKATMTAFSAVRGKKVVAEVMIPEKLIKRFLHTDAQTMCDYWQLSMIGGVQSGSIGTQGHFANALAALFIACGQDVACIAEAAVGVTRMDVVNDGLYIAVSLPNLIVGTVGGGTSMPTAKECLTMLHCAGENASHAFAEICAAVALAGEISIIGSMAAGDFAAAHAQYGRGHGS